MSILFLAESTDTVGASATATPTPGPTVTETVTSTATATVTSTPSPSGPAHVISTVDADQFAAVIIGLGLVLLVLGYLAIKAR